jgi:excisionase family DNA binding protein
MTTTATSDDLVTVEQIAAICHAHPETVRRWLRDGRVPSVKIGLRRLVHRTDLNRLLDPCKR